jgi:hypothetical protein
MTTKQTVSQQESVVSSTFDNPTTLLVHVLHSDIASLKIKTPRRRCPGHHSTATIHHPLSSNTSVATTDLKQRLLYMDRTIKATSDLVQQKSTISLTTYDPTHPLVPIAHKDTALLELQTPRLHAAAPIRYWLPMSYQDCCFSSIGGCFLSFPGFNALLPVSVLQPTRTQPTTHKCSHQPIHQHVTPVDSETRQFNLLHEALALQNEILELFAELELHQESVVPIPFGVVPTTPTDALAPTEAFPTLTDVASLLPSRLAETRAPTKSNPMLPRYVTSLLPMAKFKTSAPPSTKSTSTNFNPIMFDPSVDLQAHLTPFVPHQLLVQLFETRLFCFPVKSIGIRPAPKPPPGHRRAKV